MTQSSSKQISQSKSVFYNDLKENNSNFYKNLNKSINQMKSFDSDNIYINIKSNTILYYINNNKEKIIYYCKSGIQKKVNTVNDKQNYFKLKLTYKNKCDLHINKEMDEYVIESQDLSTSSDRDLKESFFPLLDPFNNENE